MNRTSASEVLDSLTDAVSVFDSDWRWTHVNGAAADVLRLLGCDPGSMIGRVLWDELPMLRGTPAETETRRAMDERVVVQYDQFFPGLDRWYEMRAIPLPVGVAVFSRDITERRRTADALRASEEQFRAIANALPTLAWMAHPDGHIFWYNNRWYDYTGTVPDEMEGWGWQRVHDPEVLPAVLERWTGSIRTGEPFEMEFPLRGADGRFRSFLTRVAPVRDASGAVVRWVGTNVDVTTQREALDERERLLRAERAARDEAERAEHQVTAILDSMGDAFIALDSDWRVTHMNAAAERVNGRPASDFVGRIHWEAWPGSVGSRFEREYRRAVAEGVPVHFEEYYCDPGVLELWTEIDAYPAAGGGLSVFFRDITERRRAELALQEQATELEQQAEEAQALAEELEQANTDLQESARALEVRAAAVARSERLAQKLLRLSSALNEAVTVESVADAILQDGTLAVGADAGSLSLIRESESGELHFEIVRSGGFADDLVETFRSFPLSRGGPLSDALLSGRSVTITSQSESGYDVLARTGHKAFIAVPVIRSGRPLAGISFGFDELRRFDAEMMTFLDTIGQQCAQALERARLYDADVRRLARASFLGEATRTLAASLDYETTLASIAESAVPDLGDWCAVDVVLDPTSREWPPRLERLAVVHQDPERHALGLSLATRFPTDWDEEIGMAVVLRKGVPQFFPVITDEMLAAGARSPEHLDLLRKIQFSSAIIVPLIARGLTLGALTLVMSESGRHYDSDDFALAQTLAERAAVAIDNARLFRDAEAARGAAELASTEAHAANAAKSTFLATMSHEIRTPINAVIGYTDLLQLELSGPLTEQQREQLGRIRNSAEHLRVLIEEVLDLAKVEAGTLTMQVGSHRSGTTADEALGLVRAQAAEKGVIVSASCEGSCGAMYRGDAGRVRQILANLLGNAVKFTAPGQSVSVRCEEIAPTGELAWLGDGRFVAFHVTDAGVGVASDQLERIFEPFVQAESVQRSMYTREKGGAGLGLAISRQLAHLMAGEVTVTSRVGEGSTFTLWMPAS